MDTHPFLTQIPSFFEVRWSPWHGLWFYNDTSEKFPKTTNGLMMLWNENSLSSHFGIPMGAVIMEERADAVITRTQWQHRLLRETEDSSSKRNRREEGRREFKDQKTDVNRFANSPSKWLTHVRESFPSLRAQTHESMLDSSFAPRQYHPYHLVWARLLPQT